VLTLAFPFIHIQQVSLINRINSRCIAIFQACAIGKILMIKLIRTLVLNLSPRYVVGDSFTRGWGGYIVTVSGLNARGEEHCEKHLTLRPRGILSLQSHDYRRELLRVLSGTLTVILDGTRHTLQCGEEIHIPLGGIHSLANLGQSDCIVHELQEGLCREADIRRYKDIYGRAVERAENDNVLRSLAVYDAVLQEIATEL
jgi:mannose-6-phosphate isomerase-like protein (cupin superfamily)